MSRGSLQVRHIQCGKRYVGKPQEVQEYGEFYLTIRLRGRVSYKRVV